MQLSSTAEKMIQGEDDKNQYMAPPSNGVFHPAKKPATGVAIHPTQARKFCTNFFAMKLKTDNYIFVYSVSFADEIPPNNTIQRKKVLRTVSETLNKILKKYVFTGTVLYSPTDIGKEPLIIATAENKIPYQITILKATMLSISDIVSPGATPAQAQTANTFLNIMVKSLLSASNMFPVGRSGKYLMPDEAKSVEGYGVQVWPGYKTSVRLYESGLLLEIDYTSRIIREESVLDFIDKFRKTSRGNWKEELKEVLIGHSVLARYGNKKNYMIDDIVFSLNPQTHTFEGFDGTTRGKMNMIQYFKNKYRTDIKEPNQPLLLSIMRPKEKKGDPAPPKEEKIYLAPELCSMTGLPEEMKEDFKAMQAVAKYTRLTPDDRLREMQRLLAKFKKKDISRDGKKGDSVTKQKLPQPGEIMETWHLEIDSVPKEVEGRVISGQRIILKDSKEFSIPTSGQFLFREPIMKPFALKEWLLVHTDHDRGIAESFVETLYKASCTFGIKVEYPTYACSNGIKAKNFIEAMEANAKEKPHLQMVVFLLPPPSKREYAAIKHNTTTRSPPIFTQMICTRTLTEKKGVMAICSKLILQIGAKQNMELWAVKLPPGIPGKTMIIGIDVSREGKHTWLGFSSSYVPAFTKFYTQVLKMEAKQEICASLGILFEKALVRFHDATGKKFLPELIVIYRDGVGDSQKGLLYASEFESMKKMMEMKFAGYTPKIIMATVNKKVHTRLFMKNEQKEPGGRGHGESILMNPQSGTVVHSGIVDPENYEFYIMPQFVNQGTGTPSRIHVLYDTSGMPLNLFEELTNALCYGYYNWQGAIRTPAPCKYALTHAKLISRYTKSAPHPALLDTLHFL